jgi:hypothetical protein
MASNMTYESLVIYSKLHCNHNIITIIYIYISIDIKIFDLVRIYAYMRTYNIVFCRTVFDARSISYTAASQPPVPVSRE